MPARVLAFRHFPTENLGYLADVLALRGVECECADLYKGDALPDIRRFDGLIVMGGEMSANDSTAFIRTELDVIGQAIAAGLPILGVCLGAQLIAKALGAQVYGNAVRELGWQRVRWTAAAGRHLQLSGEDMVFEWHGETFDLPAGADLLAESDTCRQQAFLARGNVLGVQFHLEATPEIVADWAREDDAGIDPGLYRGRSSELAAHLFGGWIRKIRWRRQEAG